MFRLLKVDDRPIDGIIRDVPNFGRHNKDPLMLIKSGNTVLWFYSGTATNALVPELPIFGYSFKEE